MSYLFQVGPANSSGMGLEAVGFQDIVGWQITQGIELSPWECSTIKRMSEAFVDQARKSYKTDCPSPWLQNLPAKQEIAEAMLKGLRNLNGLSKTRNKGRLQRGKGSK